MLFFNCILTKNGEFAIQFIVFCDIMSKALSEKSSVVTTYASMAKLKLEVFLKGIGGSLMTFFLAGILMTWVC